MNLTEKDAFKLGFAARCAEEQLVGDKLEARLEKLANPLVNVVPDTTSPTGIAQNVVSGGKAVVDAYSALLALPFGLSILGGAAGGFGTAKLVEPTVHEDEYRAEELANTYKLYADKAKARLKSRQYRLRDGNL